MRARDHRMHKEADRLHKEALRLHKEADRLHKEDPSHAERSPSYAQRGPSYAQTNTTACRRKRPRLHTDGSRVNEVSVVSACGRDRVCMRSASRLRAETTTFAGRSVPF